MVLPASGTGLFAQPVARQNSRPAGQTTQKTLPTTWSGVFCSLQISLMSSSEGDVVLVSQDNADVGRVVSSVFDQHFVVPVSVPAASADVFVVSLEKQ